jgi:hypothetical protein
VTFNGTAATVNSWSANAIGVTVPPGATSGNIVVTAGGAASNGLAFAVTTTQQTGPFISGLNPNAGAPGTLVTISGGNFGASAGSNRVTFNGTVAAVNSWSASTIVVTVPPGAGSGSVVVSVGGVASNGVNFSVVLQAPYITSLSTSSGSIATQVTITGGNFGSAEGTSTVTFDGTAARAIGWTPNSIIVTVPAGASSGNIVVTAGGVQSNGVAFTVLQGLPVLLQRESISSLGSRKH